MFSPVFNHCYPRANLATPIAPGHAVSSAPSKSLVSQAPTILVSNPPYRFRFNNLLTPPHKPDDTVGLIVWSAAEIAVTMICIGIPICRPLYKQWLDRMLSYGSGIGSGGYQKQNGQGHSGEDHSRRGYGLRTFGGGTMPGRAHRSAAAATEPNAAGADSSSDIVSDTDSKDRVGGGVGAGAVASSSDQGHKRSPSSGRGNLGADAPFHEATVVGGLEWNGSEEEILGADSRGKTGVSDVESGRGQGQRHGLKKQSIQVTDQWSVDRS